MQVCYIDESGCLGSLPASTSPVQPVLVVSGLFVDRSRLTSLTTEFLDLKARHFPGQMPKSGPYLDGILAEIKGSEIRKRAASTRRREWRHAIGFLDKLIALLERHGTHIVSRVWVKGVAHQFNGTAAYAYSIQDICTSFQNFLEQVDDHGLVIADSRRPAQNRNISHSIFTQKFKATGDEYGRILEMPTFGDSQNHAGIQVCDLLCSGLIQPIAIYTYCTGHVSSIHVKPGYQRINDRHRLRIKNLQHRYQDANRKWRGGVTVNDAIAKRSGAEFFR